MLTDQMVTNDSETGFCCIWCIELLGAHTATADSAALLYACLRCGSAAQTKCNKGSNMATKQNCASCKWASIAATECTYPPLNLPEATWKYITAHHAHPVKTTPHGGEECAMYDRKTGRPDPDPDARMCGNCEFFDANSGECEWSEPVPSVWQIESVYTSFYEGADCQTFKKREPEIVPATIADVTGGPWNPAPTAPALHTCGSCTWWNPRSADKRTGSCEFPVLTPASSPYPVDKTPMHETEGDDCRCFERKEG